jgi:hypothetical protein
MGRSIAAVAVGITGIVVPPGRLGGDGLFKQCAEILKQGLLPFVHKEGRGGMKRLQEGDSCANTGFANQCRHPLSQIDQFEFVPGREIKHMRYNNWCEADEGKFGRVFQLGDSSCGFMGSLSRAPVGSDSQRRVMLTILSVFLVNVKYSAKQSYR